MDALIISISCWGVLLCLVLVILALSRQIGVLYERVAPMGALTMDRGRPWRGRAALRHQRPAGPSGRGGRRRWQSQLLFFLSPSCPVARSCCPS